MFTIPIPTAAKAACNQAAKIAAGSVTLCLSITKPSATPSSSTKTVTSVRTPVTFACPGWVTSLDLAVAAILRGCATPRLLSAPPKPIPVASSKTTTSTTVNFSVQSDEAAFTPNPIQIVATSTEGMVGSNLILSSTAVTHDRQATLLSSPAQVRFTPSAYRWSLDGKPISTSQLAVASLTNVGVHSVVLAVDYLASYRFDLSAAFTSAGLITVSASQQLSAFAPSATAKGVAHLVAGSCASHPSTYRC